jgi:alpha-mannosidase
MNKLMHLLDRDPDYKTFNLDGQTIILEDYLEIHPEQREKLVQYVTEGRLKVGPWYILPDEFLSSGESIVRNLLLGSRMAEDFGHRMNVGYIPDTFGHIGQLPQILQGFGLDTCMNFRGLDSGNRRSELWWESPDGSRVLLHHLSTVIGYSDLGAMAQDVQRAAYDLRATAYYKAERATGNVLLAMQGVDHAEAREDLPMIINIANDTFDDIEFVHASLEDFWKALKQTIKGDLLETVHGELRDVPRTEGAMNFLLYNVLSSRIDNKLQNASTLLSLENWAESWCALAWMWGIADYPAGHLWTAWKWLLKNHPHDSIGGCSVDEVHRQMNTRFEWAREIADYLTEERFRLIAERVDFSEANDDELALMVFNASPWERDEVITVGADIPVYWLKRQALNNQRTMPQIHADSPYLDVKDVNTRSDWLYGMPDLPEVFFRSIRIRGRDGEEVSVQIHDIRQTTRAIAYTSGPRGVQDVYAVRASFRAVIPSFGFATYFLKIDRKPNRWKSPPTPPNVLENGYMKVVVQPNGTFDIVANDGDWNETYAGLGLLLDSGDNGDGYTFSPPPFNQVVSSVGVHPRISKIGTGVGLQQIRIEYDFEIPARLDDARHRRCDEIVSCPISVDLILREDSKRLEIEMTFDNRARDHRLQMRFPTGFHDVKEASSAMQFDVVTRPVKPEPIAPDGWWVEDPPETFPMHGWMDLCKPDSSSGLCLIAQGLHEFGIDTHVDSTAVSLTLLRAVGYLGARRDPTTILAGAGPGIPTPEAQLQQILHYRIALYPHRGTWDAADVWRQAQSFLTPPRAITTVPHVGEMSAVREGLIISGPNVVLSSLKQSEDRQALVIRLYNPSDETTRAIVDFPINISAAHMVNLQEQPIGELTVENNKKIMCIISAKKVVTLKVQSESL